MPGFRPNVIRPDAIRPDAILFDLDDTLYAERDFVRSGYTAVAEWCAKSMGANRDAIFTDLEQLYDSPDRARAIDALVEKNQWNQRAEGSSGSLVSRMIAVYREHVPAIAPRPGVPELLAQLARIAPLGLVSDGWLGVQQGKWRALGLGRFFRAAVFSDMLGRDAWKPSPDGLLLAARILGADPARCIYVADNPAKDFLAARRADMQGWRVRHAHGVYAGLEPETPDHAPHRELESLDEIVSLTGA